MRFFLLLITIFCLLIHTEVFPFMIKKNAPIPKIILSSVQGQLIDVSNISNNMPYLLVFLSLNQRSTPALIKTYQSLLAKTDGKLNIFIVTIDQNEELFNICKSIQTKNLYILPDTDKQYFKQMQLLILPTVFLISKNQLLNNIYIDMDPVNQNLLQKDLEKELQITL